jgi:SAM-dependent methyltransferase
VETDLLDVRAAAEARSSPILNAACIPLAELPDAGSELPSEEIPVRVANTGPEAAEAVELLVSMGRKAALETCFVFGSSQSPLRLWSPNPFLAEVLPELMPGRAVDLACGAGRDAAFLSAHGWEVTAIDHLPDALTRAEKLARRFEQRHIKFIQADLENWSPDEGYDLATTFFYLDRELIRRVVAALRPGGSFLFESFSVQNRALFSRPRRSELATTLEELREIVRPLNIVRCSEKLRTSGKYTCQIWAKKV